jgi:hypothetical protein
MLLGSLLGGPGARGNGIDATAVENFGHGGCAGGDVRCRCGLDPGWERVSPVAEQDFVTARSSSLNVVSAQDRVG